MNEDGEKEEKQVGRKKSQWDREGLKRSARGILKGKAERGI